MIQLLQEHYQDNFGSEQGFLMLENLFSQRTEGTVYDTIEWDFLIALRTRFINSLTNIKKEMERKISIEILAPTQFNIQNDLKANLPDNVTLEIIGVNTEKGFTGVDLNSIVDTTVSIGGNVLLGVVGNFIYDLLKRKSVQIMDQFKESRNQQRGNN